MTLYFVRFNCFTYMQELSCLLYREERSSFMHREMSPHSWFLQAEGSKRQRKYQHIIPRMYKETDKLQVVFLNQSLFTRISFSRNFKNNQVLYFKLTAYDKIP